MPTSQVSAEITSFGKDWGWHLTQQRAMYLPPWLTVQKAQVAGGARAGAQESQPPVRPAIAHCTPRSSIEPLAQAHQVMAAP